MTDCLTVMMAMEPDEEPEWAEAIARQSAEIGLALDIVDKTTDPARVDYLVYNIDSEITDFSAFTKLRAILNTWAGVEAIVGKLSIPAGVPFCRMVEPGMTRGMVEYFVGHTMRYHIGVDRFVADSAAGRWEKWSPPLTHMRKVGVLGLGALGAETATALAALGFQTHGWSRSPKEIAGVTCHHGPEGLAEILTQAEILSVIIPLTDETRNILDADAFARMPTGARVINAGRGPLIDDEALLGALASGQVGHATLDVFRKEPLPEAHAFWRHPNVTVTPHIASITRVETATTAILEQIQRHLSGAPLQHVVDFERGY